MKKIDPNIPVPGDENKVPRNTKYPWRTMAVGDSFLVDHVGHGARADSIKDIHVSMTAQCCNWARKIPGAKFVCSIVPEGVRVWRKS